MPNSRPQCLFMCKNGGKNSTYLFGRPGRIKELIHVKPFTAELNKCDGGRGALNVSSQEFLG